MKIFGIARKTATILANLSLLLNTFLPFVIAAQPAYAEEPEGAVPTIIEASPTQEPQPQTDPTPTETVTPTITETPAVTPTETPVTTPTETVTPTEIPSITPTETVIPTITETPTPTITTEPTVSPEATPTAEVSPTENNNSQNSDQSSDNQNNSPSETASTENGEPAESTPTETPTPTIAPPVLNTIEGEIETTVVPITQSRTDILNPVLGTDKEDYAPTEMAIIKGHGFLPNTQYKLKITSDNLEQTYDITADSVGEFTYSYQLDGVYRPDYLVESFDLAGNFITSVTFTDSPLVTTDCNHTCPVDTFSASRTLYENDYTTYGSWGSWSSWSSSNKCSSNDENSGICQDEFNSGNGKYRRQYRTIINQHACPTGYTYREESGNNDCYKIETFGPVNVIYEKSSDPTKCHLPTGISLSVPSWAMNEYNQLPEWRDFATTTAPEGYYLENGICYQKTGVCTDTKATNFVQINLLKEFEDNTLCTYVPEQDCPTECGYAGSSNSIPDGHGSFKICSATEACYIPACMNNILDFGEECDDGNELNTDSCTNTCKLAVCGDSFKGLLEQCDDSNTLSGDGCSATCQIEEPLDCVPTVDIYTTKYDFSDPRVIIDFKDNDYTISVTAKTGYKITKVWLDVDDDDFSGYKPYSTGPLTNFNPNPGHEINWAKVEVTSDCNACVVTSDTQESSDDFDNSKININFTSDDYTISVTAKTGYKITKVWLDVDDDNHSGYYQYSTGPLNNFNPNPGKRIYKAKVEYENICNGSCTITTNTYEKWDDFSDSKVVIDFEDCDEKISVTAKTGYKITKVELDVEGDGEGGYSQQFNGPLSHFNPSGNKINKVKVTIENICGNTEPFCGDNIKNNENEQCDGEDGVGEHQKCTSDCKLETLPYCGDGIKNGREECDKNQGIEGNQKCSEECTIINPPQLNISKSNNTGGSELSPGNSVEYKITLGVTDNSINNLKVTDLLSDGFKYRLGSYKILRNGSDVTSQVGEPQYHSPGLWDLSSLGKLTPEDKIELIYTADISTDQQAGKYADLAYASAVYDYDSQKSLLATATDEGFIDTNYVGTDVTVNRNQQNSISAGVEKTEVIDGQVLGASTEMPATGAATLWLIISSILGFFGLILIKHDKITKSMAKKIFSIFVLPLFLFLISGQIVFAESSLSVRLEQPKTPTNIKDLHLKFVALDINGNAITAKCLKKGPIDSDFSQYGSNIILSAGGNASQCNTLSAIDRVGSYQFKVEANGVSSNTINLDYKDIAPGTPTDYRKESLNGNCDFKIHFRTANDEGRTVKVELYRSTDSAFTANNDSLVHSVNIGSTQEADINNSVPDCSKTYYYALRAFDNAGNGSDIIGDTITVKTIYNQTSITGTPAQGAIPVAGSNIPGETDNDQNQSGDNQPENGNQDQSTGQILGTQAKIGNFVTNHKIISGIIAVVILAIIIYAFKKIRQGKKSSRRK